MARWQRFLLSTTCLMLALVPASADIYVAPVPLGDNGSGDGTLGAPYATISFAYQQAAVQGETVRVLPGSYSENVVTLGQTIEVSPGMFEDKWVDVIADDPDPANTVLTGNGGSPTVTIGGGGGSLSGFTIHGGIVQAGAMIQGTGTLSGNVIENNNGFAGGVRVESATCDYGHATAVVINNTIRLNSATLSGGGILVEAGRDDVSCQLGDAYVLIENNSITGNSSLGDAAGLDVETDSGTGFLVEVVVRDNTITLNDAIEDGGGARVVMEGRGQETVAVLNNTFDNNGATLDGGGIKAVIEVDTVANHRMLIDGNIVTNNAASAEGGGMDVGLETVSMNNFQTYSLIVSNNLIDNNHAAGLLYGGGGIRARYEANESVQSDANVGEFIVENNTISYNNTDLYGGGLVAAIESNLTNTHLVCEVIAFEAEALLEVRGNMIYRNEALFLQGGGAYVFPQACVNSSADILFQQNTVTRNNRSTGVGGIYTEFLTDVGSTVDFMLSHTIIADNEGAGIGGPTPTASYTLSFENSDLDDGRSSWIPNPVGSNGNIGNDPAFVNVGADDFHLAPGSPAIEAGSVAIGAMPMLDVDGDRRAVDADGDGLYVSDIGADEFFACTDADLDHYGSPINAGDVCTLDNCPDDYNPAQSDCDIDTVGDVCDGDTVDGDGDGVDVSCDSNDADPTVCSDLDSDSCDDCASGVANPFNDGVDSDSDGACNTGDADDDNDGAPDVIDLFPLNPLLCGDADQDSCGDDCDGGQYDPIGDGPDFDGDGLCDPGDPDDDNDNVPDGVDSAPQNPNVCRDGDLDTCDDCSSGVLDPANDGTDVDEDGICAAGDINDNDPLACRDDDMDGCDDCSNGAYNPVNDGPDFDMDGICDVGDPDDDNDGVPDVSDCADFVPGIHAPVGPLGPSLLASAVKGTFTWTRIAQAHVYNVYRGQLTAGTPFTYVHTCYAAELPAVVVTDSDSMVTGDLNYYLVAGTNVCGGDGSLGVDSSAVERPNTSPCGAQGVDTDLDGVLDIDDNCPFTPNASQVDGDLDTIGDACDNCLFTQNPGQGNFDFDSFGDACDTCTDTDGDGAGNPGFPANTCVTDNCPDIFNSGQFDSDGDGLGNTCDSCPVDIENDADSDGVCETDDNCDLTYNPGQGNADGDAQGDLCDTCTDSDGDGLGDPGFPVNTCFDDNCPLVANAGQENLDGDMLGDACDTCTDSDGDGFGNPGFPANVCADDNCPDNSNITQTDTDSDLIGDICDPCFDNPDVGCVACPPNTDGDGDGACSLETVFLEEGSAMDYRANSSDPGIGLDWVDELYTIDGNWLSGFYGVGYENTVPPPNANSLITETVPNTSASVYTRSSFNVVDTGALLRLELSADFDDGYVAWINGQEVFRSPEMPLTGPDWNTESAGHESSNNFDPVYGAPNDISTAAVGALKDGTNVLAIGVWNTLLPSSDLVLVPRLSARVTLDNCEGLSNPTQSDTDSDGIGDACDGCTDSDGDGFGDPGFVNLSCPEATEDNCPLDPNPLQEDFDGDGIGDDCDACTDTDDDGFGDPGFPQNLCLDDNCPNDSNPTQTDTDADLVGDACDPCFDNADLGCVACPNSGVTDVDGDGVCHVDTVFVEEGTAMDYRANTSDPSIPGFDWTALGYTIDGNWQPGFFGIGFDDGSAPNADMLITTTVPSGSRSVYTRFDVNFTGVNDVIRVLVGADYDDGYMIWVNDNEVFRSPELPAGVIEWDPFFNPGHEPSNQADPVYDPLTDVTGIVQGALVEGNNEIAIGLYNRDGASSDLVIVPYLSVATSLDNCPNDSNPGQEDGDADDVGDACDPTP